MTDAWLWWVHIPSTALPSDFRFPVASGRYLLGCPVVQSLRVQLLRCVRTFPIQSAACSLAGLLAIRSTWSHFFLFNPISSVSDKSKNVEKLVSLTASKVDLFYNFRQVSQPFWSLFFSNRSSLHALLAHSYRCVQGKHSVNYENPLEGLVYTKQANSNRREVNPLIK